MGLSIETKNMDAYLQDSEWINFKHPLVRKKIEEFQSLSDSLEERAKLAFLFVRDEIKHSFDLQSKVITISASDTLENKEGICFAKSHLLAAFLRGMGIPTGFCYQRVTRKGTPESGFALHGLNAVYFADRNLWFRLDPRGNKPGVNSEFSIEQEKLAYPIRTELGEVDYLNVFSSPLDTVIDSMKNAVDCHELFGKRPEQL